MNNKEKHKYLAISRYLISISLLLLFSGNAVADPDGMKNFISSKNGITAYTWNSNASAKESILSTSSYTFNYGRKVTRKRESKGIYRVNFEGLNCNRGQFTVNAYGGTEFKMCRIGSWSGDQACEVSVYCFAAKGKPLDSQFNLLFID